MSPAAQKRVEERTQAMLLEMNLQELRQHCTELTQEDVARLLEVTQAYVSSPGQKPWMRYPAVSFAEGVRSLPSPG
jgi:hypothetical protein